MSFGIIFWGNSPHSHGIFKMQKRVFRILMGIGYRESCRELFKEEKILTLPSQYIFSLLHFVICNMNHFVPNIVHHNINIRQKNDLQVPHVHQTKYQKGVLYSGIKVFNVLPSSIKTTSNSPKKFKATLKHYLLSHSFYSVDEFFSELKP